MRLILLLAFVLVGWVALTSGVFNGASILAILLGWALIWTVCRA